MDTKTIKSIYFYSKSQKLKFYFTKINESKTTLLSINVIKRYFEIEIYSKKCFACFDVQCNYNIVCISYVNFDQNEIQLMLHHSRDQEIFEKNVCTETDREKIK